MLSRLRREQGQDLIEFALIMPILAMLLFGIMEFGIIIFSYNTIGDAARVGARKGVVVCSRWNLTCDLNAVRAEAVKVIAAAALKQDAAHLTITADPTTVINSIQVTVRYKVDLIPGIMGRPDITLQARSTMQREGYPE